MHYCCLLHSLLASTTKSQNTVGCVPSADYRRCSLNRRIALLLSLARSLSIAITALSNALQPVYCDHSVCLLVCSCMECNDFCCPYVC